MASQKVTITTIVGPLEDDEDGIVGVTVAVDGREVGGGSFGGEHEDNIERRDYSWVRPLLRKLCKALGADVDLVTERERDSEEEDP